MSSVIEGKKATVLNEISKLYNGDYMIAVCGQEDIEIEAGSVFFPRTDLKEIHSFVYFDSGNGYSESHKLSLVNTPTKDGVFEIETDINIDKVKKVRYCIVFMIISAQNFSKRAI